MLNPRRRPSTFFEEFDSLPLETIKAGRRSAKPKTIFIYELVNLRGIDERYNGTEVIIEPDQKNPGLYCVLDPKSKQRLRSKRPPHGVQVSTWFWG